MHGELDIVYDTLRRLEEAEGIKIDLLLCCGDFQVRAPRPHLWRFCGVIRRLHDMAYWMRLTKVSRACFFPFE